MPLIETLVDSVRNRINECSEAIANEFRRSVRPIFGSPDGTRPELIGSCLLVAVDNIKYVVTAAHVIDWSSTHALFVGGLVGTEPVQILGQIKLTQEPLGRRCQDKIDLAFWEVPTQAVEKLGDVKFIDQNRISYNQAPTNNRMYMAMGYPLTRNKRNVNNVDRKIKIVLWKYIANVIESLELAEGLGVSGNEHFFLAFEKYSTTASGQKVSSINPKGISGGALIDLGNFASMSMYDTKTECIGMLSGMVIEKHKKHLVAVKIEHIVNAIRKHRAI
jgi:hypothetical protein